MSNVCPDCASPIELTVAPAELLSGTCASCGHSVTVVRGPSFSPSAGGAPAPGGEGAPAPPGVNLACPECEAPLEIVGGEGRRIETVCSDCEARFFFAIARPESDDSERPRRGRSDAARDDRPPRTEGRPCRECGGRLRFSTAEDGGVVGECESCGNRFTLPPRTDRRGGGGGYGGGFGGGRRYPPRAPGRTWRPGRPDRAGRGPGAGDRRAPRYSRSRDTDGDDERPRRRRRPE